MTVVYAQLSSVIKFLDLTPDTDVGATLNAALAALDTGGTYMGAKLHIPKGTFYTSVPIVIPNKTSLHGQGRSSTALIPNSSFPVNTHTVTITHATPAVVSYTSHGMLSGDPIYFTTSGALPAGLTANTWYTVSSDSLTSNTFQVSPYINGYSSLATTTDGSGTHTCYKTTPIVQLGDPATYSGMSFDCYVKDLTIAGAATSEATIGLLTSGGQEGSGARSVSVENWNVGLNRMYAAIWQRGGLPGNMYYEDVDAANAPYAIRVDNAQSIFHKISAGGNATNATAGLIILTGICFIGSAFHFERCVSGLKCNTNTIAGIVNGVDAGGANDVTNLIDLYANAFFTVNNIARNLATYSLLNSYTGLTYTDDFIASTNDLNLYAPENVSVGVSVGASPYTYRNLTQRSRMYVVQGGTVSSITLGRAGGTPINIGVTSGCFIVAPGDTGVITYSSLPTVTAFPL